jgi:hypothetical protein
VVRTVCNRARRSRWLSACAATLLAVSSVGVWALQRAANESPLSGVPNRQVTKPAGVPVGVSWRARVTVPGAEFRVYRGPDEQHLQQVAALPANVGEREYRFRDRGPNARDAVYEVRFADRRGDEQVVARAFCARTASMGHGGVPPTTAQQDLAVVAAATLVEPAGAPTHPLASAVARTRPRPEPLDSPPRRLAG